MRRAVLERSDFDKLVAILAGHRAFAVSPASRRTFLETAFHGYPRSRDILDQLELDGAPRLAASGVIIFLDRFGALAPGSPALRPLLNALLTDLGDDEDAAFVRELFRRYPLEGAVVRAPDLSIWPERPSARLVEEAMLAPRSLLPIFSLQLALEASRAVVRVSAPRGDGTGFMVSERLVMTNHHVIPDRGDAKQSAFTFGWEVERDRVNPGTTVHARSDGLFAASKELDYALIEIEAPAGAFKPLPIRTSAPAAGEYATIIQHPRGNPKQIALRDNVVVVLRDDMLYYTTSTDAGSSGSPVLDDSFRVIALHRAHQREIGDASAPEARALNLGTAMRAILSELQDREEAIFAELRVRTQ